MIRLWNRHHPPSPTQAERARDDAAAAVAATEARTPEVHRVARSLRDWREKNHVVAQLDQLFYGGRP